MCTVAIKKNGYNNLITSWSATFTPPPIATFWFLKPIPKWLVAESKYKTALS